MGLPVTVYRYTDAGAPQIVSGTPTEWINVLKKVLVEGYGAKSPLGWTLEFEDAGVRSVAFRNATTEGGSGGYVKFYSTDGSNTAYKTLGMKCAMGMTGIDAYFKPLWARGFTPSSNHKGWEIIGTKRGFYLILHYTVNTLMGLGGLTSDTQVYFIGDIHSVNINDTCPFTIVSASAQTSDVTSTSGITDYSGNTFSAQMYALDGSNTSSMYSFLKGHAYRNSANYDGNAESLGINHSMIQIYIYGVASQNNNQQLPFGRGFVPGLYISSFAGYRTESWPKELTQDTVKWVLLRSYVSPQFWISLGDWYD
ncbi:hypothetical protein [Shewanella baltica]|uniref:hypothetical protein n=1 Tax=Shewanella baltica TaxID=62322 RepID=UPI003D79F5BA